MPFNVKDAVPEPFKFFVGRGHGPNMLFAPDLESRRVEDFFFSENPKWSSLNGSVENYGAKLHETDHGPARASEGPRSPPCAACGRRWGEREEFVGRNFQLKRLELEGLGYLNRVEERTFKDQVGAILDEVGTIVEEMETWKRERGSIDEMEIRKDEEEHTADQKLIQRSVNSKLASIIDRQRAEMKENADMRAEDASVVVTLMETPPVQVDGGASVFAAAIRGLGLETKRDSGYDADSDEGVAASKPAEEEFLPESTPHSAATAGHAAVGGDAAPAPPILRSPADEDVGSRDRRVKQEFMQEIMKMEPEKARLYLADGYEVTKSNSRNIRACIWCMAETDTFNAIKVGFDLLKAMFFRVSKRRCEAQLDWPAKRLLRSQALLAKSAMESVRSELKR
jgi:hypothetical protein